MADTSLSHRASAQNLSLPFSESLAEQLRKAHALLQVAMGFDLTHYEPSVIHDYLWVVGDLIQQARIQCEALEQLKGKKGEG